MNILKILMNTEFTPFAEFDYDTYAGASKNAMIGEYKDMMVVVDGDSKKKPGHIEVFDETGECIYSAYLSKNGRNMHEYDASGHKRS